MISIIFYFKAGKKTGLGNLSRCRSLAIELGKNKNISITIAMNSEKIFKSSFRGLKFKWINLSKISKAKKYDIIIVDITNYPLKLQKKLQKRCNFLVGIDDWGKGPFLYNFLLRPNPLKLPAPKMIVKKNKVLQGKNYILLNPKFERVKIKKYSQKVKKVFICFGGSDPQNYTLRVIKILLQEKNFNHINFIVVVGAAFSGIHKLNKLLLKKNNFKVHKNPTDIINLYNDCDSAIVSGGYLLYEACALSKPSLILPQEIEQHNESKIFERRNAIIRSTLGMKTTNIHISKLIKKLIEERSIRYKLYKNCQKSISRKGSKVVAKEIIKYYRKNLIEK